MNIKTKKLNTTNSNCVFCVMAKKTENILYENDLLFVLADIYPLSSGHILVIPKEHAEFLHELNDNSLSQALVLIKKIANALGYKKYNVLQNNGHIQSVPHVHFHVIPYISDSECLSVQWKPKNIEQDYFNVYIAEMKEKLNKILKN